MAARRTSAAVGEEDRTPLDPRADTDRASPARRLAIARAGCRVRTGVARVTTLAVVARAARAFPPNARLMPAVPGVASSAARGGVAMAALTAIPGRR